jgi:hypothetical protein
LRRLAPWLLFLLGAAVAWLVVDRLLPPRHEPGASSEGAAQPARAEGVPAQSSGAEAGSGAPARREVGEGAAQPATPRWKIVDDDNGAPVAGAIAWSLRGRSAFARSGADGVVELGDLRPEDVLVIAPEHVPWVPGDVLPRVLPDGVAELRLAPDLVTIRRPVCVLAPDGAPIGGARLQIAPVPTEVPWPAGPEMRPFVLAAMAAPLEVTQLAGPGIPALERTTGADGAVMVRFLAAGRYRLSGQAADLVVDGEIEVHATAPARLIVSARPGALIRGRIVDARTGAPVAAVRITTGTRAAASASDGTFEVGPVAGAVPLRLTRDGYRTTSTDPLAAGEEHRIVLEPEPTERYAFEVRSAGSRAPLGGVRVVAEVDGVECAAAVTDEHGSASFDLPGSTQAFTIAHPGFLVHEEIASAGRGVLAVDLYPDAVERRVAAGASATIRGRVVDAQGVRLASSIPVRATPVDPTTALDALAGRAILRGGRVSLPAFVPTGDGGSFAIECTAGGAIRLEAIGGELGRAEHVVVVELGRRYEDVELVLR